MLAHFPIALVIATLGIDVLSWWSADPDRHRGDVQDLGPDQDIAQDIAQDVAPEAAHGAAPRSARPRQTIIAAATSQGRAPGTHMTSPPSCWSASGSRP